jgi:hypothetical protein
MEEGRHMMTVADASAQAEQAMRAYLHSGNDTATPGGLLYILADLCRERARARHAVGDSYDQVAFWTLWAERVIAGLR